MSKAIVTQSHKSEYPDPIEFRKNDALEIGRRDTEYPGWIRVTTGNGNEGWAPESYIDLDEGGSSGRARCDYCAAELDIEPGEQLEVGQELSGWCRVTNAGGVSGWVPRQCLELEEVRHGQCHR